jgi:hypothetical protein
MVSQEKQKQRWFTGSKEKGFCQKSKYFLLYWEKI